MHRQSNQSEIDFYVDIGCFLKRFAINVRKKETTLTLRSGCTGAGGEKNRVDTHTSKRLRHRRGARKRDDTHTSHRLGRRRGVWTLAAPAVGQMIARVTM